MMSAVPNYLPVAKAEVFYACDFDSLEGVTLKQLSYCVLSVVCQIKATFT